MFEIFAALFGGAYLASRFSKDKRNKEEARLESVANNAIMKSLINYSLEENVRNSMFYTGEIPCGQLTEYVKEIYKFREHVVNNCIPEPDLEFIFGNNWRDILATPPDFLVNGITSDNARTIVHDVLPTGTSNRFWNKWGIVYNVYLSSSGVVSARHLINGYQIGQEIKGISFDDRVDIVKRACRVIERNIQAIHGKKAVLSLYISTLDSHSLIWGFTTGGELRGRLW